MVLGITGLYMLVEAGGRTPDRQPGAAVGRRPHAQRRGGAGAGVVRHLVCRASGDAAEDLRYCRVEILAALANGVTLVVIALGIFYEAFHRFFKPEPVESGPMLVVAVLGLVVNIIGAVLLSRSHQHSLNLRGAFLHILGDLVGSAGAIIAALVIMGTGWYQADPLVSVVIGFLILASAWTLCRETINVLLEGTPVGLAFEEVEASMRAVPGVMEVGDLHLWSITSGIDALSAHVALKAGTDPTEALCALEARPARPLPPGAHHDPARGTGPAVLPAAEANREQEVGRRGSSATDRPFATSRRSASIGCSFAAFRAGQMPKKMPMLAETPMATTMLAGLTTGIQPKPFATPKVIPIPSTMPMSPPSRGDEGALDQELLEDVLRVAPERLADPDLAGALGHRHQHDVHDPDPAHRQRDRGDRRRGAPSACR